MNVHIPTYSDVATFADWAGALPGTALAPGLLRLAGSLVVTPTALIAWAVLAIAHRDTSDAKSSLIYGITHTIVGLAEISHLKFLLSYFHPAALRYLDTSQFTPCKFYTKQQSSTLVHTLSRHLFNTRLFLLSMMPFNVKPLFDRSQRTQSGEIDTEEIHRQLGYELKRGNQYKIYRVSFDETTQKPEKVLIWEKPQEWITSNPEYHSGDFTNILRGFIEEDRLRLSDDQLNLLLANAQQGLFGAIPIAHIQNLTSLVQCGSPPNSRNIFEITLDPRKKSIILEGTTELLFVDRLFSPEDDHFPPIIQPDLNAPRIAITIHAKLDFSNTTLSYTHTLGERHPSAM